MKKKLVLTFIVLVMFITLTACNHIEDTNGLEDYTIETYTDEDIIEKSSYTVVGSIENNINSKMTKKASKFSGVYDILSISPNNETLSLSIESTCESGNFRIVLIKDEAIVKDIEINSTQQVEIENAMGKYIIKIVGESAKFSLKIIY